MRITLRSLSRLPTHSLRHQRNSTPPAFRALTTMGSSSPPPPPTSPYKPRFIDVRPSPPPPRKPILTPPLDRHQPYRSRLQRRPPRHLAPPRGPPLCHLPRPRCRINAPPPHRLGPAHLPRRAGLVRTVPRPPLLHHRCTPVLHAGLREAPRWPIRPPPGAARAHLGGTKRSIRRNRRNRPRL